MTAAASDQRGAALVLALVAGLLLSAIGVSLVVLTSADVLIADHAGAAAEAFHAADGALERALAELAQVSDFTAVLNGSMGSRFTDGPPDGTRTVAGGVQVSLPAALNEATCHLAAGCSEPAIVARSRDRPWGSRNPRWRLFSYGPTEATADTGPPAVYVIVMIADDPSDTDDDPWLDGGPATGGNAGAGVLLVRAEAFGRRSSRRVVEAVVYRPDLAAAARWQSSEPGSRGEPPALEPRLLLLGWREAR